MNCVINIVFSYRIPDNLNQVEKVETTELAKETEDSDFEAMVEDSEETNDENVKQNNEE